MLTIADFRLGRMAFPTIEDVVKEAVGDALEATGMGLAAGEGKARSFPLVIPVRASSGELNPYADGDRMRRQVRSMMENPKLRLGGLFMRCLFDPELNAWLLVGAGDLEYDDGGVTFANYKLSLNDSFMVGRPRTHRAARRIESVDRRLSTTPRDIEKIIYSTSFAASAAAAQVALPSGAVDLRSRGGAATVPLASMATADAGSIVPLKNVVQGDVVSFEQPEASMNLGDVLVLDRRGFKAPAGLMEAKEPQATYGWEEVYGTDYPLSSEDVPVLSNGLCRIRHLAAPDDCFAIDQFSGGAWVERGRVVPQANTSNASAFTFPAQPATVKEWTPERAVVMCRFNCQATATVDVYIILQRGWTGPRIEVYARPGSEVRPNLSFYPADSNHMALNHTNGTGVKISSEGFTSSTPLEAGNEPWISLSPLAGTAPRITFAIGAAQINFVQVENTFYYGSTRYGLRFEGFQKATAAVTGWCGVQFAIGGEVTDVIEAEAHRNSASGTTSQIADGAASGGQTIQETQAAETNPTVLETPSGGTALGLIAGNAYTIMARVRVVTAGATGQIRAAIGTASGASKSFTSTTYVWVNLGTLTKPLATSRLQLNAWRSAGTGNVLVDRFVVVPFSNVASADSVADIGAASLYDARAVPELVAR